MFNITWRPNLTIPCMILNPPDVFHSNWQFDKELAWPWANCVDQWQHYNYVPYSYWLSNILYCFIGVIVGLTTVYKLYSFFTIIFAVVIIKIAIRTFSRYFILSLVWIAVSSFNKTIEYDFVFHKNYVSITHRTDISWNDVMAFSPLGDAAGDLYLLFLKGRTRLYISV